MSKSSKYVAPTFSARVRFNWGFHDAARDTAGGHERQTVVSGPGSMAVVSAEHDVDYYRGYLAGIAAWKSGEYRKTSEPAWQAAKSAGIYTDADDMD